MSVPRFGTLFAVMVFLACAYPAFARPQTRQSQRHRLTAQEIVALKTAILDEIYDYNFEGAYTDISPLQSSGYRLPLYIRPEMIDGDGEAIYKLPIGEVLRDFQFKGNLAVLFREPRDRFPPTSSSTLTLYLNDDQVCSDKRHWIRDVLWIDPNPSKQRIHQAILRQRKRKGESEHDVLRDDARGSNRR